MCMFAGQQAWGRRMGEGRGVEIDPCSAFGSKSNFVFPSLNPAERGSPRRNLQDQDGASILKQGREPQDTQLRVPPPAGTPDPAELAAGTPCVSSSTPGRHSTQTPTDV